MNFAAVIRPEFDFGSEQTIVGEPDSALVGDFCDEVDESLFPDDPTEDGEGAPR